MIALLFLLSSDAVSSPSPTNLPAPNSPAAVVSGGKCDIKYYPESAIKAGIQGTAFVGLTITAEGFPTNLFVKKSSGNKDLDDAALTCVQDWRFKPSVKDNIAVESSKEYAIQWSLGSLQTGYTSPFAGMFSAIYKCAESPAPASEELEKATRATTVEILFSQGKITDATVAVASGNPSLDQRVLDCTKATPANLYDQIPGDQKWMMPVDWKRN